MNEVSHGVALVRWWAALAVGTATALLIAWLSRLAGVPLHTVLSIVAGAAALGWLVVLVALPWNLHFGARRAAAELAVACQRGIAVRPDQEAEAARIARRTLWFALGAHLATAVAAGVVTYYSGATVGYYLTGAYLLSATIRPAAAYLAHLRERIGALSRDSRHPRDDVITLREKLDQLVDDVAELREDLPQARRELTADLRGAESRLADGIAHARQLLTSELAALRDAHADDREASRSRDTDLARRIEAIARRITDTLDGISDHREIQTGLRALVRMIRAEAAPPT